MSKLNMKAPGWTVDLALSYKLELPWKAMHKHTCDLR